jgi:hypothetical protein
MSQPPTKVVVVMWAHEPGGLRAGVIRAWQLVLDAVLHHAADKAQHQRYTREQMPEDAGQNITHM